MRTLLFDSQAILTGVPQWWDLRTTLNAAELSIGATVILCDPDNAMFAADGPVIFLLPDGTTFDAVVDTVQAGVSVTLQQGIPVALPVLSEILPLGTGFSDDTPSFNDARVNYRETSVKFLLTSSEDIAFTDAEFAASEFTKHPTDSKLVLDTGNVVRTRFRHRMEFAHTRTDSGVGKILQFPVDVAGTPMRPVRRGLRGVAEIWQFKKLIHYLRGSWRSFYLPTFQPDFVFANATQDLNSLAVIVNTLGIARAGAQAPHRDVYLTHSDGRTYTRRITNVVNNGDGTETITLATAFEASPEIVNTSDLVLSWAELVRINGDVVTFVHERPGKAEARFNVRGVVE